MEISFTLVLHAFTGSVAVLAGAVALGTKKGGAWHHMAGKWFLITMLIMGMSGVVIAYQKPMMISVIAGAFTCYLVLSSWMTMKTPANTLSRWDYAFPVVGLLIGVAGVIYGLEARYSETGLKDGFSAEPYFFFAALALLAGCLDLRIVINRGLSGAHRLARHLWRMCFALYIAVGSLFAQGTKSLPTSVRESVFMSVPENLVALLLVFWLIRVFVSNRNHKWKQSRPPKEMIES